MRWRSGIGGGTGGAGGAGTETDGAIGEASGSRTGAGS